AGNVLVGETSSSLTLSNVTTGAAGQYSAVVSGACGSVTNSASLTVTLSPSISCVANKSVELGVAWTFDSPTANYLVVVVSTVTNMVGHCGNTFDATRTWQATDPCGNSAQCSQAVNIVDTTAPVINCSSTNKTAQLGATWTFNPTTATDNGGTKLANTVFSTITNSLVHL